ncbi:FAD-dependent oxidoreductase [Alicyclobacillus kakegawensis]|uniref:FAD-dependent oxidoreductase n=1 Tax=Alicyclobacillus kakegawensis TaxID=392012 RepID=UPI0008330315|nr:NAD(P)/FAD-dependent oxidoreductase [Alicyclobacillus kakegawensis]
MEKFTQKRVIRLFNHPVVIVGAGPVGLTVAEILTSQGIPVTVLEKGSTPSKEWRASTFHAATLELLEPTGLSEALVSRGLKAETVQYRDRVRGLFAEFDCSLIRDETRYPFRLQCPQSTYVQVVYERLQQRPSADIRFNAEVVDFTQDGDGVTVQVDTPSGREEIRASFLLGADGARSSVRKRLGFAFSGYTLEQRFLLIGTPVSFNQYLPEIAYVNYISDPDQFLFILRVPEAWRLLYPVPPEVSDEAALAEEPIQASMQQALGTEDRFPIVERMIYRVHQRVSERFYDGRVILLGDAAHVNSPLGGLGLNSGIHDAVDLGRRFLRIAEYRDFDRIVEELETYSEVRRQVALAYVRQISERNTNVLTEKDPVRRLQLQQEMAAEAADPVRARQWLLRSTLLQAVREQGIGTAPKRQVS